MQLPMTAADMRVIVFDLDGTLIDSLDDISDSVNATLARLDQARSTIIPRATVQAFIGEGVHRLLTRCLEATEVRSPIEEAVAIFRSIYREHLIDRTRLYPGVVEVLDRLCDYRLAVLSNKPGDMSRSILEGLNVSSRFVRIVGGDDVAERKPHPAGLLSILSELGAAPRNAVMVGDSGVDVRAGRAAGTYTIGVTYGFAPNTLRDDQPDVMLVDMWELPEALASIPNREAVYC
jgi:phosphoglycolate phosphatase